MDHLLFMSCFFTLSRLFIAALWAAAGKADLLALVCDV